MSQDNYMHQHDPDYVDAPDNAVASLDETKEMWAIRHLPSNSWHNGDANLTLYWTEHEARLEASRYGSGLNVWKPIKVKVTVVCEHGTATDT